MLSDIELIFDSRGLISPVIVRFKMIIQKLWLTKISLRFQWRTGRGTEVHPGSDGVVWISTVHTLDGSFSRAVRQLCPLLFEGNQPRT